MKPVLIYHKSSYMWLIFKQAFMPPFYLCICANLFINFCYYSSSCSSSLPISVSLAEVSAISLAVNQFICCCNKLKRISVLLSLLLLLLSLNKPSFLSDHHLDTFSFQKFTLFFYFVLVCVCLKNKYKTNFM